MTKKFIYLTITVLLCFSAINAHDIGMHVYIGSQTFNLWQDYDPEFYNALILPDTSIIGFEVRKFYYIGLTLPDLLRDQNMSIVRGLINTLYEYRDSVVREWYGSAGVSLDGPLYITDTTYQYVQIPITYAGGELPMNSNFAKVYQMVQYARNRNWGPKYKALIYGCYMHVIHDLFIDMALIPSCFGYGFAIDSDSALSKVILFYAETYNELLTPTHLTEVDYRCIEQGVYGARRYENGKVALFGGYFDFYPVWKYYNEAGQMGYEHKFGWQKMNITYVDSFVKAMNAVFNMNNLTRERLESYLHGWAILTFFIYGHERVGEQNINIGGLMAHPNWTPSQIADFWDDIGDDFFQIRVTPAWFIDLIGYICCPIILPYIIRGIEDYIAGYIPSILAHLPYSNLRNIPQNQQLDWYIYLQTPSGLDVLKNAIPPNQITPEVNLEYARARQNVFYWNEFASVKKPNFRGSYDEEKTTSTIYLQDLYKQTILNGNNYIDCIMSGINLYILSRKAGLLGGMYSAPNENYIRQPGVLNAGFKKDGNPIWTNITVGLHGDSVVVNFFHDLITFGPTRLRVIGKTSNGNEIELQPINYNIGDYLEIGRWTGNHPFNLKSAANQGINEISFRIATKNKNGSDYTTMFSSDYHQAFDSSSAISGNRLYQAWLNYGEPIREPHQNPFQNPLQFWPYACSLKVVDWYLNSPHSLTINSAGVNKLTLRWFDVSNWEGGYEIERTNLMTTNQTQIFNSNSYTQTGYVTWDDNNAELGQLYKYKVRAKRDNFYSENWTNEAIGTTAYSDISYPTAFGNQAKVVNKGNNVHLVYYGYDFNNAHKIIYLHSNDGGNTWDNPEPLPYNIIGDVYPSIALDQSGRPHIVWLQWNNSQGQWVLDCYHTYKENGIWRNPDAFSRPWAIWGTFQEPPFPVSGLPFVIRGDSGFSAIILPSQQPPNPPNLNTPYLEAFKFPLYVSSSRYRTTIFTDETNISPISEYWTNRPNLVIDGRRIVVCYNKYSNYKLAIRWWSDSIMNTSCTYAYNPHAIIKGQNLLITWYSNADPERTIKYAKCQRINNGYTQPNVELAYNYVVTGEFPLLTAPRLIDDDLLVFHDKFGIYYSVRKNNVWNTSQIYTDEENNNFCPQSCVLPNLLMVNPILKTFWTNGNNRHNLLCKNLNLPIKYYVACEMATGPNNGVHLDRIPNSKELCMVFQEQNHIYYPRSNNEGENWETEEIDNGLYPCIGINYQDKPWIAYCRDGDLLCKIRREDGSWKEILIFDGDENHWAGPPSMQLATMPIEEDMIDYAYVTYAVYECEMPENILV
jgi:hypothetical protein